MERKHLKRSIISFGNTANAQEEKGIKKYGKPLDPMDDYDWLDMATEELVDAFKYLEAEKVKRKAAIYSIRELINNLDNSTKQAIEGHLQSIEGNSTK